MPRMAKVTFRYIDSKNLPLVFNEINAQAYRINSLFDPDYQTGGRQPPGYDYIANMYRNYTVYKVFYRVTFSVEPNTDIDSGYQNRHLYVGTNVSRDDEQSPVSNAYDFRDQLAFPSTRFREINPVPGNRSMVTFKGSVRVSNLFKKNIFTNTQFSAATNANPARVAYLYVWARNAGASISTTTRVRMTLTITFKALMRAPVLMEDLIANNEDPLETNRLDDAAATSVGPIVP